MQWLKDRSVAIIACADLKAVKRSGKTALELAGEVTEAVLCSAGIERDRIDGMAATPANSEAYNPFWTSMLADSLGLSLAWSQINDIGGASIVGNILRAGAAVHAGLCEVVLVIAADAPSTQFVARQSGFRAEFCDPFGYSVLPLSFALLTTAYSARYGSPDRALAKLAVTQRNGALLNDRACDYLRVPLTEEDYLASRMISYPLRLLDCVMRCDGANAFLVTSTRTAKQLGCATPVHPIAYRELINFDARNKVDDITVTGFSEVGPAALRDAGLIADQIQSFHPYDDFFIAVLLQLEQIGFSKPGQGVDFVLDHDVGIGGDLPINTGGGQISAGQPGLANGGVNLIEAVRQLRGEAGPRQLPGTTNAMVTGIGVIQYARNWGCSNVMILERGA